MSDDYIERFLTWPQVSQCAHVACMRNIMALSEGWTQLAERDMTNTWSPNIEGACAELIIALYLGICWVGEVGNFRAPDVGPYQVRCNMSRRLTDLCLRHKDDNKGKGDDPDKVYISVLSFLGEEKKAKFVICGWIWGRDGFAVGRKGGTEGRPPAYYISRAQLRPMSELPTIEQLTIEKPTKRRPSFFS